MDDFIHLSPPDCARPEAEAAARAVASGWSAPVGPELDAFEAEMAAYVGVEHAVALSSGTAALHLALLSAGAAPGTCVVTSTFTFAATANAIVYTGARPVFVDCDPTGNIDPALLEEALDDLEAEGTAVSAVLAVDIYGRAADYERIVASTTARGIPLVCDGAEALGAKSNDAPVGSLGLATAISFNGNKIMTTSGGGMVTTDDDRVATEVRKRAAQSREPVQHYEHVEVGFNYRMSNVLAAIGRVQLQRLDSMIAVRRSHRRAYREAFADVAGLSVLDGNDEVDNCWLTNVLVESSSALDPLSIQAALAEEQIESRRVWKPLHRQPAFEGERSFLSGCADAFFARGLSLPSGSSMSVEGRERVIADLSRIMETARVR